MKQIPTPWDEEIGLIPSPAYPNKPLADKIPLVVRADAYRRGYADALASEQAQELVKICEALSLHWPVEYEIIYGLTLRQVKAALTKFEKGQ